MTGRPTPADGLSTPIRGERSLTECTKGVSVRDDIRPTLVAAPTQAEAIAQWEQAGLCWRCGHGIDAHGGDGCDWEIRDYGDMDCGCTEYLA